MQIFIAGIDRTNIIDLKTLRIEDTINERSIATFSLNDLSNTVNIQPGQTIEIIHEEEKVFGGTIDRIVKQKPPGGTNERVYKVECTDYHQITDRRIVAEAYEDKTAGYIINDIVSKYLIDEGITVAAVQDGPTINRAVFNYIKASQALDELSELVGFSWWIDADKKLHFVERATYSAPWVLDDITLINDLVIDENRENYRNRQYIRAGNDITVLQTEKPAPKPDGQTRTFTLKLPVAKVPTVKVNGDEQTVGIRELDKDKQWYWQKGDKNITQDDSEAVLNDTDILEVTYQGFFPIIVVSEALESISERKNVEGGSGIYEDVEEKPGLDSGEAALDVAQGKLRKYANLGQKISFNTWHSRLKPGQILSVNLPDRELAGDFLIQNVELSWISGQYWRYNVTAVSGETVGGWPRFFRQLVQSKQTFVIRENEILIKLLTFRDEYKKPRMEDEMTYILHQYPVCGQITCGTEVIL